MSLDEARVVKILYDAEGEAASLQFGSSLCASGGALGVRKTKSLWSLQRKGVAAQRWPRYR